MSNEVQHKHGSLASAVNAAIELSTTNGTACIILSRGSYYVEEEPGMIRVWEELIGQYEKGELMTEEMSDKELAELLTGPLTNEEKERRAAR